MTGLVFIALLNVPAAPVPAPVTKPAAVGLVDRFQAQQFADTVDRLAQQIGSIYVKELDKTHPERVLLEAAIRGLYEEVGTPVPEETLTAIRQASAADRVRVLVEARMALGNHPNLSGAKSLFAAMNGFKHATDPSCALVSPRMNTFASVDQDFGVGIELDGVVGMRWTLYQVEHGVAAGRFGAVGWFGPAARPEAIPCPAGFPWRVRRVIPGSPAQKAGVKPGDVLTHLNGTELTADNANKLFPDFASPHQVFDPQTGRMLFADRTLTFRRGEEKPFSPNLKASTYIPESVFGVQRLPEDKWDCLLDRKHKIGYIRLGPIETGLDAKFAEMMADLKQQGCRALILDLRWCPGGYVDPGARITGMFLKDGAVIAKMDYRNKQQAGSVADLTAPAGGGKYADLPLVVLVGQETTGGGELIACGLRDNDRCVIVGQRTVGRAMIQSARDAGFAGVQFRVTTGTSLRPNGKNRQKTPDSQPTDDWGVRPDEGLEVPITMDKSTELRRQADLHALRPAESREALPFDDADADPYRLAALGYLRKQLGPLPILPVPK